MILFLTYILAAYFDGAIGRRLAGANKNNLTNSHKQKSKHHLTLHQKVLPQDRPVAKYLHLHPANLKNLTLGDPLIF